jgi:hypothetical protein
MRESVEIRITLTETQGEQLQERIEALPFKLSYREEQHGAALLGVIACSIAQEKSVRDILDDIGASVCV